MEGPSEKSTLLADFIECYRRNRSLWDRNSPDYNNPEKKELGYRDLQGILCTINPLASIADVKRKINILNFGYRREQRKVQESLNDINADSIYQPSVWWFHSMEFIGECQDAEFKPRMFDAKEPQTQRPFHDIELARVISGSPAKIKTAASTTRTAEAVYADSVEETSSADDVVEEILDEEQQEPGKKKPKNSFSEVDMDLYECMAKAWASKMRALPNKQRIFAEKAIHDILFEAEMGTLNRESVKINGR